MLGLFSCRESKLIGIERLKFIPCTLVLLCGAVFGVAEKRVSDMRKLCSYLMRSAGQQLNFKKREAVVFIESFIFQKCGLGSRAWGIKNPYYVLTFIFKKKVFKTS